MLATERVSVACLLHRITSTSHPVPQFLALLHLKSLAKGQRVFNAVGGAIELTPMGMQELIAKYSATGFEKHNDARFLVPPATLESVLQFFLRLDSSLYETDPRRELEQELASNELPDQHKPILTPNDVGQIETSFVKSVRQGPGSSSVPSPREAGTSTTRLFFIFDAILPDSVYAKLAASEFSKILTPSEVQRGYANDGTMIGGNLFV